MRILRLCRLIRAHYWDVETGKPVRRVTVGLAGVTKEEPCPMCIKKLMKGEYDDNQ